MTKIKKKLYDYILNGIKLVEPDSKEMQKINDVAHQQLSPEKLVRVAEQAIILRFYNIRKTIILFLVALIISILFDYRMFFIVLLEFYLTLRIRRYSGKIHLPDKYCTAWGFLSNYLGYFFAVSIVIPQKIWLFIFILCTVVLLIYAPKGMPGMEIRKEQHFAYKCKTLKVVAVLFFISCNVEIIPQIYDLFVLMIDKVISELYINQFIYSLNAIVKLSTFLRTIIYRIETNSIIITNVILWVIIIQTINVLPILYKIFNIKEECKMN